MLHRFLHRRLNRDFAHFEFFLNTHLGFKNFANVFVHLNLLGQGLFKNVKFVAICAIFLCEFFYFAKNIWIFENLPFYFADF